MQQKHDDVLQKLVDAQKEVELKNTAMIVMEQKFENEQSKVELLKETLSMVYKRVSWCLVHLFWID